MRVRVFTDGACSGNPGPGGWALTFLSDTGCMNMSGGEKVTTNNRMELLAVVNAMREIERVNDKKTSYEIFSDSAYVVNAINQKWIEKWLMSSWKTAKGDEVKNRDLWEEFIRLRKRIREAKIEVILTKVKGHAGNAFNEHVDKIARNESLKMKG